MLKNYFKIAWRNLTRNKVYAGINIAGLAAGLSACLLIFLYVQDELSFDQHFAKADRIYRMVNDLIVEGEVEKCSLTSYPLAANLQKDFPEIEKVTRLMQIGKRTVWAEERPFNMERIYFTDSTFFDLFDYKFLAGSPAALARPDGVILTRETAELLFGSPEQAVGKQLKIAVSGDKSATVLAVLEQPAQAHFQFNLLAPYNLLGAETRQAMNQQWGNTNTFTYFMLKPNASIKALESKLDAFYLRINHETKLDEQNRVKYIPQPITQIHLHSDFLYEPMPLGSVKYLYIFGMVAVFILLIACINYMNLATARSLKRAKEVGLRKVIGAHRWQLIRQFTAEGILLIVMAAVIAVVLVELLLPFFNDLTGKQISLSLFTDHTFALALVALLVGVALAASSYPAFYLSSFSPSQVFNATHNPRSGTALLRKALVVVQFTISLILVIGTIVVVKQMRFLQNADLGFSKEQLVAIDIPRGDTLLVNRLPVLKAQLLQNPHIQKIATTQQVPSDGTGVIFFEVEKENGGMGNKTMNIINVDHEALDLFDIKLLQGRNFSKDIASDKYKAYIVNEATVKALGWTNPIGKRIKMSDEYDGTIVGVVKDFHYKSLHNAIEPLVISLEPKNNGYVVAKVSTEDLPRTIAFLQEKWTAFDPAHPMEYFFVDEHFNEQYRAEEKMLTVFGYFTALTILIACLGLFGLISYMAEHRTKEIGIRKVLGGSVSDIVLLLTKDFAVLVLVAIVVATPIAWWGMHKWLEDFAYRTQLSWWVFALAGLAGLLFAMLTVSMQAIKAALLDPVKALRTE